MGPLDQFCEFLTTDLGRDFTINKETLFQSSTNFNFFHNVLKIEFSSQRRQIAWNIACFQAVFHANEIVKLWWMIVKNGNLRFVSTLIETLRWRHPRPAPFHKEGLPLPRSPRVGKEEGPVQEWHRARGATRAFRDHRNQLCPLDHARTQDDDARAARRAHCVALSQRACTWWRCWRCGPGRLEPAVVQLTQLLSSEPKVSKQIIYDIRLLPPLHLQMTSTPIAKHNLTHFNFEPQFTS